MFHPQRVCVWGGEATLQDEQLILKVITEPPRLINCRRFSLTESHTKGIN